MFRGEMSEQHNGRTRTPRRDMQLPRRCADKDEATEERGARTGDEGVSHIKGERTTHFAHKNTRRVDQREWEGQVSISHAVQIMLS